MQLLVAESGRAGMRVDLRTETGGPAPDGAGRTAYRIIQEGLTNARKHAPGAAVRVRLVGAPGQGLTVEVANAAPASGVVPTPDPASATSPAPTADPVPVPPPGQGLVGLAERVALADGRLEHGPTADGGWQRSAWLPWPP